MISSKQQLSQRPLPLVEGTALPQKHNPASGAKVTRSARVFRVEDGYYRMLTFRARSNHRFFGSSGDGGASGGASAGAGGGAGGAPRATVALIPGGRRSSRIADLFPSALKTTTASRARPTARRFAIALPRRGTKLNFASSSKWAKRHSRAPAAWR